jgi:hypothetical protein
MTTQTRFSTLPLLLAMAGAAFAGCSGETGAPGANGTPGGDGDPGSVGDPGTQGDPGTVGDPGIQGDPGLDLTDPVPADLAFSFAVTNNSGGSHNGAAVLTLEFDGTTASATNIVSTKVTAPPILDGKDDGMSAWGGFESTVALTAQAGNDNGITSALMRSVYTADDIYFFAEWTEVVTGSYTVGETTQSRKLYTYDNGTWTRAGNEDRAFFAFPIDDADFESNGGCVKACHGSLMYTDAGDLWDVWHWKAARTGPSGSADDKWWDENDRNSDYGMSAYMEPTNGSVPLYMHIADPGTSATYPAWIWDMVPYDAAGWTNGDTIPGVISRIPTGSRGDVTAIAKFVTDTWTLEIKRARNTGNGDDIVF